MYDWEEQNMRRLVTFGLLVEFRVFQPVVVPKTDELLVKTGKNENLLAENIALWSDKGWLRSLTAERTWDRDCRLVSPPSSKWRDLASRQSFLLFFLLWPDTAINGCAKELFSTDLAWFWAVSEILWLEIWLLRAFKAAIEQMKGTCIFIVFIQPRTQCKLQKHLHALLP